MVLCLLPLSLAAIPAGEKVVHGDALIDRHFPDHLVVSQMSDSAIVEWETFSLGEHETARFVQPDAKSSILNRVTGGHLSEIYGRLESNGRVFVVNPQGVLVGESGRIDCASFIAAALQIDDSSFLQGQGTLFKESASAKVVNKGKIRAFGGPVFLIGPDVENTGGIEAKEKAVFMIIGDEVGIDSFDRPQVMIRPTSSSYKRSATPYALAVNGEEVAEAAYVRREGGRVFLDEEPLRIEKRANPLFVTTPPTVGPKGGLLVEETLDALQQLRTLIPDRLWEEEFAMLVDAEGFQEMAPELAKHPRVYASQRSVTGIGSSEYYFMHAAMTGEPIRLDDRYLEFLDSPYWKTPEAIYRLYYLQHNYQKVAR